MGEGDFPSFDFRRRILSRMKTVVLPYFLWALIAWALTVALYLIPGEKEIYPFFKFALLQDTLANNVWNMFEWFVLMPKVAFPLWYLRDLTLLVLLSPLFLALFRLHPRTGAFLALVPAISAIFWVQGVWPLRWIYSDLYILDLDGVVFFSIGALLALLNAKVDMEPRPRLFLAFLGTWIAVTVTKTVLAISALPSADGGRQSDSDKFLLILLLRCSCLVAIPCVWLGYDVAVDWAGVAVPQRGVRPYLIDRCSNYSMWVFCAHEPGLMFIIKHFELATNMCEWSSEMQCIYSGSWVAFAALYFALPALWLLLVLSVGAALNRCCPRAFSLLTGGRLARRMPAREAAARAAGPSNA